MTSSDFWSYEGDEEDILARYLAEHAYDAGFVGKPTDGMFAVGFGDEGLLPEMPQDSPVMAPAAVSRCSVCDTELRLYGTAGWRHEIGFKARGGCTTPWPC